MRANDYDFMEWVTVHPVVPLEESGPARSAAELVLQVCGGFHPISVGRHLGCCATEAEISSCSCRLHPELDGLEIWCSMCEEALIMDRDGVPIAIRIDGEEFSWPGEPDLEMFVLLHCQCGKPTKTH